LVRGDFLGRERSAVEIFSLPMFLNLSADAQNHVGGSCAAASR
jgi:hypothetical protein